MGDRKLDEIQKKKSSSLLGTKLQACIRKT